MATVSTLTIPNLTIETAATLTVNPASNTYTHKITYSFSGLSGTIATLNAGVTTATWTPPSSFYAKLPNSTSGTVTIVLKTLSGGTEIGSKTYNKTVKVGSSIKPTQPTVTVTPVNTNPWIHTQGLYVAGYSKIEVQSSATAGSGASMASYTVSGAFSGTGSDVISDIIPSSGSKSVTVTAADTRGRTSSKTVSGIQFLAYSNPTFSTFSTQRGTWSAGTWTPNVNGNHIRVQAVGTVSLSTQGNTGTITVKIGNTGPDATSGNYYYFTSTSSTTSYTITGTITDDVGNTFQKVVSVNTVEVPFNIDVDIPGIGVGKVAENAKTFELATTWKARIPPEDLSTAYSISKTSGNSTVSGVKFHRSGNVCQLYFEITSSASVNAGTDLFFGTTNAPYPIRGVTGVTFVDSSALVAYLNTSGTLTVRVTGATVASGKSTSLSIVYITNS